LKERRKRKDLC